MADYENSVGIQLETDFDKAIRYAQQLSTQLNSLNSMVSSMTQRINSLTKSLNSLNNTNLKNLSSQMQNLMNTFNRFSNLNVSGLTGQADQLKQFLDSFKNVDLSIIKQLQQLPKTMESISAIDSSKVGEVFSTLATQIQPFIAKLKEASAEIQGLSNITNTVKDFNTNIKNAESNVKSLGNQANKTSNSIKRMFTVGNLIYYFNMSKRIFDMINNSIKSAIDFRETENLFAVAMGNMKQEAMKFQNSLAEVFGLALPDTMQYTATFKNMLSSIEGLAEDSSTRLSNILTKMQIDFSSLYNVSIESAGEKLQSALSRQVRPIRSVSGMDITQNVLGASLQQIGIYDRTISQLSEMEKRLLIIYTLQQQMANAGALGDFAKTIKLPAQQLRILQQQIQEVGRWLGAVFETTIWQILPYINAFTMVIKELIKAFALLVGYQMPDSSRGENILDMMDDTASDFGTTLGDGIDKATEKVKNLLAPFDKVNVLTKPEDSSSSSSGSSALGGIDSRILDAIEDYDVGLEKVSMKATQIRDRIMEWFGFTKQVNEETGEVTWQLKEGWSNLKAIGVILGSIAGIWAGMKIASVIKTIIGLVGKLGSALAVIKNLGFAAGLKTLASNLAATNPLLSSMLTALSGISASAVAVVAAIVAFIGALIQLWNTNEEWKNKVIEAWNNICETLSSLYENILKPVLEGIATLFNIVWKYGIKPLWDAWVEFVGVATGAILDLWNAISPILNQLLDLVGVQLSDAFKIVGAVIGIGMALALNVITVTIQAITAILQGIIDFLTGVFSTDWGQVWNDLAQGVSDWWEYDIKPWFTIERWQELGENMKQGIITKWEEFKNWWSNTGIVQWWNNNVAPWFTKSKWVEIASGIKEGLVQAVKNAVNGGIGLFNSFIDWINQKMKISWGDKYLFGKKIISGGSITLFTIPHIPYFEKGGIVPMNAGQLFVANEPGNPELVGNIGGQTAVVNNKMILDGIKSAMKSAIIEGMQLVFSEQPNGDIYVDVYVDGVFTERKMIKENEKHLLKTGKMVFTKG